MQRRSKILIVTFAVSWLAATLLLFLLLPPSKQIGRSIALSPPFSSAGGFAFGAKLSIDAPSDVEGGSSTLDLYEDGTELRPAHAQHESIRTIGRGAFSHWGDDLYFSASDNSDPNSNGKRYSIGYATTLGAGWYIGVLAVASFILLNAAALLLDWLSAGRIRTTLIATYIVVVCLLFLQTASWTLVESTLARKGATVRGWYDYLFEGKAADFRPGLSTNYVEHHYLNYALNPLITYGGFQQFNSDYRIRRSEAIFPRDEVPLRILALGGSTTFGELLTREADTWVYQLERRIRASCSRCEVINGGVGGYTVLENFIHYIALLAELKPDVVLLYEGINDAHARLFGNITHDYSNYRIPWRSSGTVLPKPNMTWGWLYPYRLYFLSSQVLRVQQHGIGGVTSHPYPASTEWLAALKRNGADVYRTHLRNLSKLILAGGSRVVIIPQHYVVVSSVDEIFIKGVAEHNIVNREVANELGVPFLQEVIAATAFDRSDTFDNCHFNGKGGAKMADLVVSFLVANGMISVERQ